MVSQDFKGFFFLIFFSFFQCADIILTFFPHLKNIALGIFSSRC